MDVVFFVCIVTCGAVRASCMGSMSGSSCRWCMCVSCVHAVAVLNDAFCMTCSLLMLVEDARGDHMEEAYSRAGSHDCFIGSHEYLILFTPSCCSKCFYHLLVVCVLVLRCCECVCCI